MRTPLDAQKSASPGSASQQSFGTRSAHLRRNGEQSSYFCAAIALTEKIISSGLEAFIWSTDHVDLLRLSRRSSNARTRRPVRRMGDHHPRGAGSPRRRACSRPGLRADIMSAAPIPKTAPFADEEIESLNGVVGPATAVQRAWLAGFLAGLDAAGGEAVTQPAAPAQPAEPLTILYATESGNSEKLAGDVAKSARKMGLKPSLIDMADLDVASLAGVKKLVVIAATWGEGDAPARAVRAYKELMSEKAPRLDGAEFGVLALGDTAYAEFCAIGKALDERLAALGAKRIADRVDCDLDFAEPAAKWIGATLNTLAPDVAPDTKVIAVDFGAKAAPNLDVVEAEVTETINLNSSRSDKETYHLELSFDGTAPAYKPGDSFDLYAENDPNYVDALLASARISDATLRAELIKSRDVTTLSLKTVETYATFGQRYMKELLDTGAAKTWIVGRQLIDL